MRACLQREASIGSLPQVFNTLCIVRRGASLECTVLTYQHAYAVHAWKRQSWNRRSAQEACTLECALFHNLE
jgi:hypothetical protein